MDGKANPLCNADITCVVASYIDEYMDLRSLRQVSMFHRELLDEFPETARRLHTKPQQCGLIDFDNVDQPRRAQFPAVDGKDYGEWLEDIASREHFFHPLLRKIVPGFSPHLWMQNARWWTEKLGYQSTGQSQHKEDKVAKMAFRLHQEHFQIETLTHLCRLVHKIQTMPEDWDKQFLTQPPVRSLTVGWRLTYHSEAGFEVPFLQTFDRNCMTPKVTVLVENREGIKLSEFMEALTQSARDFEENWRTKARLTARMKRFWDLEATVDERFPVDGKWTPAGGLVIELGRYDDGSDLGNGST